MRLSICGDTNACPICQDLQDIHNRNVHDLDHDI